MLLSRFAGAVRPGNALFTNSTSSFTHINNPLQAWNKTQQFTPMLLVSKRWATKLAGGTAKNGRDSNPKYLGWKRNHGQLVRAGTIIVRQKGLKYVAGDNVGVGKDSTLYALVPGVVQYVLVLRHHLSSCR